MGFCDSGQQQQTTQGWQDPLGPTSMGPGGQPNFSATGAPQMRSQIFNYLGSVAPQLQKSGQAVASQLGSDAANPYFNTAQKNAESTIAGDYLNGSPELDRAMATQRAQTMASAADNAARIKSTDAKNGMAFSTGDQQALEANNAAANATAQNTSAQTYLQNYLAERGNQINGVNQLQTAQAAPLNYLSGQSGAITQPLNQEGNLLTSLSGGGQVFNTGASGTYSPSLGSSILNGFSGVMGSL